MSKRLQAYFQTEDEAEHVRILLQAHRADQIEVGAVGDTPGRDVLLMPLSATVGSGSVGVAGSSGLSTGHPGEGAPGAFVGFHALDEPGRDRGGEDDRELRYVLSAHVDEAEYEKVAELVRRNSGHVLKLER
ncbi:hypothetical protein P9314_18635 [Paenibacillus validus]|uniref:Uncharacterized protein n=1 Tax=Paenibacillus validus TaxID=44253 RepID=A0A7X2ZDN3_9BACL|nr:MULTISPECIES: hypothetical protein [Paenibacillus]MED4602669.1 hypothetical protein [Paenibacillus validus]MED4608222.1 hypothetical protein [Paenibacillus validus]MUG73005.1 hypothetical protein [Paenibacillus validus]